MMYAAKILVIEDDAGQLLYLKHVLTREGYKVITAGNGVEALHLLGNDNSMLPDIIITDLNMPGGSADMNSLNCSEKNSRISMSL